MTGAELKRQITVSVAPSPREIGEWLYGAGDSEQAAAINTWAKCINDDNHGKYDMQLMYFTKLLDDAGNTLLLELAGWVDEHAKDTP